MLTFIRLAKGVVVIASFEEKGVWIQLMGMTFGLGAYFVVAGRMLAAGETTMSAFATLFIVSIVVMVIFLIVGYSFAAMTGSVETPDERDRLIKWRASYHSSRIMAVGILAAIACLAFGVANVWTANLLLLSLALSEVINLILQLMHYHRGSRV